jgi:hypothetical protein
MLLEDPVRRVGLLVALLALFSEAVPSRADQPAMMLSRVSGSVGYAASPSATPLPVVATLEIPQDDYALTQAKSQAALALPDSSVVTLGEKTIVQVGQFENGVAGPGSTITIEDGALHFNIRHPNGGKANYTFVTPTAQIAVRGTEGVISHGTDGFAVAVVHGADDDVQVTDHEGHRYRLPVGKTLRIRRVAGHFRAEFQAGLDHPRMNEFRSVIWRNHQERLRPGYRERPGVREAAMDRFDPARQPQVRPRLQPRRIAGPGLRGPNARIGPRGSFQRPERRGLAQQQQPRAGALGRATQANARAGNARANLQRPRLGQRLGPNQRPGKGNGAKGKGKGTKGNGNPGERSPEPKPGP